MMGSRALAARMGIRMAERNLPSRLGLVAFPGLIAALLLIAAACGSEEPTATPSPSPTATPVLMGDHVLMFSSDYPHAESRFPNSVDLVTAGRA